MGNASFSEFILETLYHPSLFIVCTCDQMIFVCYVQPDFYKNKILENIYLLREQICQTLILSNFKSVIGTHMCYICQLEFMPKEKSVLLRDFKLQLLYVNPYLGKFSICEKFTRWQQRSLIPVNFFGCLWMIGYLLTNYLVNDPLRPALSVKCNGIISPIHNRELRLRVVIWSYTIKTTYHF